ncbi:protein containing DUF1703 [Candidatus Omnitrophus magneticus]|uniref:Protein containing DUF1703 n=1 Tax=Candidatus Omnitrophus magneticus TaxID=1609969 RepID=A0A0F0CJV4_9BACT|nr:protein containing DUF1703 [Candidatus Omnitrophus magneticus]
MRNFLSGGFKDNTSLEKGVLTGILRVSKEFIFSGMNNLGVFTILSAEFNDKFGLTGEEVQKLLIDYNLDNKFDDVRAWYNGYNFEGVTIYNPWSIINYAASLKKVLKPYWANSSDNKLIEDSLTHNGKELKNELLALLNGENIVKTLKENITFEDLEKHEDMLWSLLLFSGYLTASFSHKNNREINFYNLSAPNLEVRTLYYDLLMRWFDKRMERDKQELMLEALEKGNIEDFEFYFSEFVLNSFSYFDTGGEHAEKVYKSFVLGLFVLLADKYELENEREAGAGRCDLILIPKDKNKLGIIIEFKKVDARKKEKMPQAVKAAFKQIEEKQYDVILKSRGIEKIKKLAIVFQGKKVWVREGQINSV